MKGLIVAAVTAAVALFAAGAGVAAPPQPQTLSCQGLGDVQILVGPANGADQSFGAARIVGDGHLIPVDFQFSAFDVTTNTPLFDSGLVSKGSGNGNHNQSTIFCSETETATLADFLDPGEPVPPGATLSDIVTFTIDVNAILKS